MESNHCVINFHTKVNKKNKLQSYLKLKNEHFIEMNFSVIVLDYTLKSLMMRFRNFFSKEYVTLSVQSTKPYFINVKEVVTKTGIKEELIRDSSKSESLYELLLRYQPSISLVENTLKQTFSEHVIFKVNLERCPSAPNMQSLPFQERLRFDQQSLFWHLKNKVMEMNRQTLFAHIRQAPFLAIYYFPSDDSSSGFFHLNLSSPYNFPSKSYQKFICQIWYDHLTQDCFLIFQNDYKFILDYEYRCNGRGLDSMEAFKKAFEPALTQIYTDFKPKSFFRNFL